MDEDEITADELLDTEQKMLDAYEAGVAMLTGTDLDSPEWRVWVNTVLFKQTILLSKLTQYAVARAEG